MFLFQQVTDVLSAVNTKELIMNKRLSAFALIFCLASSLAFADETSKSSPAVTASTAGNGSPTSKSDCPPTAAKEKKQKAKPAQPSPSEEQEFEHLLLGIHG
jgi:hypothetical protein